MIKKLATRNIFPSLDDRPGTLERMDYVEERLNAEAEAGTLYLSDVFRPPNNSAQTFVGLIMTEHDYDSQSRRFISGARPMDGPLADYKVELEAIEADVPTYAPDGRTQTGTRKVQHKIGYKSGKKKLVGYTSGGRGENRTGFRVEEMAIEYPLGEDAKRGKVPAKIAWQILQQCGEECSPATPRTRCMQWRVREIPPGANGEKKTRGKRAGA